MSILVLLILIWVLWAAATGHNKLLAYGLVGLIFIGIDSIAYAEVDKNINYSTTIGGINYTLKDKKPSYCMQMKTNKLLCVVIK